MRASPRHRERPTVEPLEPRVLFSADPASALFDAAAVMGSVERRAVSDAPAAPQIAATDSVTTVDSRHELVFVDARVADQPELIDDIRRAHGNDVEIVVLDANRDGIQQISERLAQEHGLDAVHIVSHGEPGALQIGATRLDFDTLLADATAISRWRLALNSGADLMLYGCDLAASSDGRALVDALARLTGADVAASTDATGNAARQADWELEYRTASIEASVVLDAAGQAAWNGVLAITPTGSETLVNGTTTGTQSTHNAVRQVAIDANGNFVVVWSDTTTGDVMGRRFNANGTAAGAEFRINTTTGGIQDRPAVAMDNAGNFVVVWQSAGQDGSLGGVYAQRFNASGVMQGGEFLVSQVTAGDQLAPTVAMDRASGAFIMAWSSADGSGFLDVAARRFDANGNALGNEFRVNTYTTNDQEHASIALAPNGNFVIAWESYGQDGGADGIYAQRYDANGVALGSEFLVTTATTPDQFYPTAAISASGNFVVTWTSVGQDGSLRGIYGQRFDSVGNKLGSEFLVNTTTANTQEYSVVTMDAFGNFVVTWDSYKQDTANSYGIYAREYSSNGVAMTAETLINTTTSGDQSMPSVAWNGSSAVFVWSGNGTGDAGGVFFRQATITGPGVAITPSAGLTTTESGGTASFGVVLNYQPTANVTVSIASSDTTEGTVSTSSLTFTAANWNVAQTVTVTGIDDAVDDGNVAYNIVTSAATSADTFYNGTAVVDVALSNVDNDTAGATVAPAPLPPGGETRVNVDPSGDQGWTRNGNQLATDAVGNFVVVWTDSSVGASDGAVVARRFAADGTPLSAEIAVSTNIQQCMEPSIAMDALGNFVVSWSCPDGDGYGVYVQRFDASGAKVGGEFRVNQVTAGSQSASMVAMSPSGQFVVTWRSENQDGSGDGVYARRYAANGTALGSEFLVNTVTTGNQNDAAVVMGPDNNFVIAWTSDDLAGHVNVYLRRYDASGAPQGGEQRVNTTNPSGPCFPSLAMDSSGNCVVVWTDWLYDGSLGGVFGQRFNAAGVAQGGQFLVNVTTYDTQMAGSVAMDADGNFVVAWMSSGQDGDSWGVYMRQYAADGTPLTGETQVNTTVTGGQVNPSVACSGAQAVVAWVGAGSDRDVFFQRFQTGGVPVTSESGGIASFSVVLTSQPTADVTIPISSSDTTEGTVSVSSLTFTPANWNIEQTVTVTGVDDAIVDGEIAYSIVTGAAVSADASYNGYNAADFSLRNVDNDVVAAPAGITVSAISGNTTEAGGTATFNVVLTSQPTANVTISIASNDTTEGTVSTSALTFTTANWNVAQTVTVTGVDDAVADGNVAYSIVTGAASSADASYNGMAVADVAVTNLDNDAAGFSLIADVSATTTEAGGTTSIGLLISSQPTADVTIAITSSDTTEGTVSTSLLTFTAANWNAVQWVTVTGVDDAVADGNVAYSFVTAAAASADASYNGMALPDVSVTNLDNDTAGVTVSAIGGNTTEAGGTASFNVVLTSQPTANVTISIASNDTTEGTVSTSSLTFTAANWNVAQVVTVTGVDDALDDGNIAYSIVTGAAVSADAGYNGMAVSDVAVTNIDNDTAGVTVSAISGNTTEAGGTATFNVVLTSQPTANVTISIASNDTTEGTVSTSSLTFTAANWNVAQVVTVTGMDDAVVDGNIAYSIVTGAAVSADASYNGMNPADVAVTTVDNDTAGITVSAISGNTTEAGGTANFSVVLTSQPTANVTISIASNDTTEGTVSTSSLTFTAANWNVAQVVTVTGVNDAVDDGDIAYSIVTGAAVSADGNYSGRNVPDVAVTNLDNDTAGINVSAISGNTTEAGGSASFSVVLTSQPTANVTISIASNDTTEGTVSTSSLTFTAANWNVAQVVTVTGVDDAVDDGDIAYSIVTGAAVSADPGYNGMNPADVAVTTVDNDTAGISVSAISGNTTEAGGTGTFSVVLTSQPTADVTISVASSDTTEGTVSTSSLTFTAANWNVAQVVTVTGVDDAVADGNIAYSIVTGAAVSADAGYNGMAVSDVAVTNIDNDTAGVTVSSISGNTTEAGGTATFSVVLTSQPTANVTISIASNDTTEGTVSTSSLTFTAANWNVAQVVTVTGVNDAVDDGDVAYSIVTGAAASADAGYNGTSVADVLAVNIDNDTAGITVSSISGNTSEAGGAATFNVVLTSQPTANVTISIASNDTTEGTVSTSSLTFTVANWNVAQTVTVTGVNDAVDDGDIAYSIVTGAAVSADAGYNGMAVADVAATNVDNDTAGITVSAISGSTTEAGGTANFSLVLTSQPTANVTISIASNDTTEGTVSTSSLTFTVANWNVAQQVTVTGVDDALDDGDVIYSIVTGAAVSADAGYSGMAVSDVSTTNVDNDAAGITVSAISGSTTEAGGTANFSVVLTSQPTADVTISIASNDTTEGTVSVSSLTFTAANWNVAQVVGVTGVDDAIDDGNIAYSIVTGVAVSADASYNGMVAADVSATNVDNDTAGINVSAISSSTTEAGGSATFSVVLTSQPTADVTISIASGDTTEGSVSTSSLTFTAANWNLAQVVTVTGVDDAVDDGDVAYSILTGAASSADAVYGGMSAADIAVTNVDNDTAGITVSPISGNTTEAGGTATFSIALTSQPTADVTISIASDDTTEGTVSAPSLIFTAANWNVAQVVTVTGVNDAVDDGDIAYSIVTGAAVSADGNYGGRNAADVGVTNLDDDTAGINVSAISGNTTEAGGTATFSVVLTSQPTADVTIAIASSDMTEGTASVSSLTFTAANWNVARTVTVTGIDDAMVDGSVAYSIVTGAAVSADASYNGMNATDVTVTNLDNDTARVSVTPTTGLQTTEAGATASFGVMLTSQPTADVTISIASSDTTEGTVSISSLTFTAANWNVAQQVTVTGVDDAIADGNVAYSIVTGATVSTDANYNGLAVADVAVTNLDSDTAGIVVSPISGNTTEAGGSATFSVVLATQPTADVTVSLASSNAAEGTISTSSLTFTAANWNLAQNVTVTGVDDAVDDGNVAYNVVTGAAVSSDVGYNGLNAADVAVTNLDDDTAGITVSPISGNTTEAGGTANCSVVLTSQPTADVTIAIASSDTTEGTVSTSSLTFTAANWNLAQAVTVTGADDAVDDGNVAYSITTGAATSIDPKYAGLDAADVAVTNLDDDAAAVIVSPISGDTTEAGGTATFTIALASQPTADVTIALAASDPTEGAVSVPSVVFTAANWNVAQTITVTGVDDAVDDGDVTFAIATGPVTSGDATYHGLNVADVAVTNVDDDSAGISVSAISGNTTEAGGSANFSVVLTSQPTADVTIALASSNTAEGAPTAPALVFTAANWNVAQTVGVSGADDALDDGDVAYSIVTGAAVSADANYNGINPADVAVTNVDNDTAGITISAISGPTTEAGGSANFSVALTSQPTADVTIAIASSNTTEGTVSTSSLTFTAANWNVAQVVTVTGVDDAVADGSIAYSIVTGAAVSADPGYNAINPVNVAVTNVDNDTVGITVSPIGGNTTEAGGSANFSVVLNSQPTADVTIAIASSDTTEGTVSTSSLTFTAANWNVTQTVTVTGADDALDDGDAGYTIVTGAVVSIDPGYNGLNAADVAVTNLDNDTAGITVSPISGPTTEAGGTATFNIVLDSQPTADVTISIASGDITEGTASASSLTFTAANWNVAQVVTVTGVDDAVDDGAVAYSVTTGPATSTDPKYAGLDAADVAVTNLDDDAAAVIVSPVSGNATEAGGTATFSVVLTSQPSADVTISVASDDTSEGAVSTSSLTFTAANWNVAQTITVTGVDDAVDDGDITFAVVTGPVTSSDATYNGLNVADAAVTNVDNDSAGISVSAINGNTTEAGGTANFSVVLSSQPTADVTIALASSNSGEGTPSGSSLTFTAANWNVAQIVTVTGVDDAVADGDIAYSIVTGAAVSADPNYDSTNPADVAVTNVDNDTVGISVSPISGNTTEAGGTATFSIALVSQPTADVTISIAASDTSEGTVSTSTLTFTAANWNVAHVVTVTGVDDAVDDGDIGYSIVTGAAVSADANYGGMTVADVAVTNVDNDTAGISVSVISGTTTEAGGGAVFSVVLASQPTADVTIAIASSDTTEGTVSTSSLTFTAATWNVAQVVTVTGVDDAIDDGDIAFSIITSSASSADANYNGFAVADVAATNLDNDTAGIVVSPISGNTNEAGGSATFSVALTSQPTADVAIAIASSDTTEGTVSNSSLTFTGANWNVAQVVTVTGVDDAMADGDVGYSIVTGAAVSADANYDGMTVADVAATNVDNDIAGISVSPINGSTTEAGGTASFGVVLTSQPTADVTISIASSDTTEGTVSTSWLTFTAANWNVAQVVTVTGLDDAVADGDVAYSIVTGAAVSADASYSAMAVGDVAVTNVDNDAAGISVSPISGNTTEAGGTANFSVVLTSQPTADVTLSIASSNTSEGTVSTSILTFTAANWNVAQVVTVTGVDDAVDDGDTAYSIVTGAATSADANYNGMTVMDVVVTNVDNDTAGISISAISGNTTEAGGTAGFNIVLTSQPTADVIISLASNNTNEGTVSTSSLTFTAANWNVAQTVTVTGVDDAIDDGDLSYSIVTGAAASADNNYDGMAVADVAVTNVDNDTAGISVSPVSGNTTEAGGTATFNVALNSQPTANVTISIASGNTSEGTISISSLTFTATNWNVAQQITVTGVDDAVADGNVTYSIVTDAAVSADANYNGLAIADVAATNLDNDTAGITVSAISGNTTEAGGTATFNIVLDSQPTADVTISIAASDTAEGAVSASSLTFTASDWNVAQVVTVTGVDDAVADGDVSYSIVTGAAVSADAGYNGVAVADVAVTNVDNDTVGTSVSPISGNTTEAGGSAVFSVVLTSQPTADVTIALAVSDPTEGAVSVPSVVFTVANWNVAQTITVTGVDDAVDDDDVTYSIVTGAAASADVNYNGMTVTDVVVTNVDNDSAGISVSPISGNTTEAGSTANFNIVLTSQPTANVTISLASSNQSEGTPSASSLTFTAANWNVAQVVTVTGVDDAVDDGDIAYSIVTDAAASTDANYNGMAVADVAVINVDNDSAGISVSPISGNTTEAGGSASFGVVLTSQPTADVTISIASSDTTEGTVSTSSLTFTAANWNVAQVVTVTGVDDALADGDVAYSIVTGDASSADASYAGMRVGDVATTNLGNDIAPTVVLPAALQTGEDSPLPLQNTGLVISDANGDLTRIQLDVSHGTLALNLDGGAALASGATGSKSLVIIGTQAQLEAALATLTYVGDSNWHGIDQLRVAAADASGLSDTAVASIDVLPANDAHLIDANKAPSPAVPRLQLPAEGHLVPSSADLGTHVGGAQLPNPETPAPARAVPPMRPSLPPVQHVVSESSPAVVATTPPPRRHENDGGLLRTPRVSNAEWTAGVEADRLVSVDADRPRAILLRLVDRSGEGKAAEDEIPARMEIPTGDERTDGSMEIALSGIGIAMTAGSVWWALRLTGLLGTLFASLPAWRQIDLLPILADKENDDTEWSDDDEEAARDEAAVGRHLFSDRGARL